VLSSEIYFQIELSTFSPRHLDRRQCYRLSSSEASLSHWASNFVYISFGVARFVCDSRDSSEIKFCTRTGTGTGTVNYPGITAGKPRERFCRSKSITAVIAGTGTVRAVIPRERESKIFYEGT